MNDKQLNFFERKDVIQHNSKKDLWIIIDNHVFDITNYAHNHPGGINVLLKYGGKDVTEEFNEIAGHNDSYINSLLDKYCIGKIKKK